MDEQDYAELIEEYMYYIEKDKRQIILNSILLLIVAYRNYYVYGDNYFLKTYQIVFRLLITIAPSIMILYKEFHKRICEDIVTSLTGDKIEKKIIRRFYVRR